MADNEVERLMAAGEHDQAITHIEQLLAGEMAAEERIRLTMELAQLLDWHRADTPSALVRYREALAIAESHSLPAGLPALGVGQTLYSMGLSTEALPYLIQAAESSDATVRTAALSAQGDLYIETGEYEAALTALQGAQLGPDDNQALTIHVFASTALALARLERFAEAEEVGLKAVSLAKEQGDPGLLATCFLRMGQIHYQQDQLAGATYWFQQGVQTASKAGLSHLEAIFREAITHLSH